MGNPLSRNVSREYRPQARSLVKATDWEDLLKQVESSEVDPIIMVTHRLKADSIAKAY